MKLTIRYLADSGFKRAIGVSIGRKIIFYFLAILTKMAVLKPESAKYLMVSFTVRRST